MRLAVALSLLGPGLLACASSDVGQLGDVDAAADAATPNDASRDAAGDASRETFTGEGTWYATDGRGACGFPASPSDLNVAAMNQAQYSKAICGECVLVTGPHGSVKVRIVDLCTGCARGDLDLSKQAFGAIAPLSAGRVAITWYVVPC